MLKQKGVINRLKEVEQIPDYNTLLTVWVSHNKEHAELKRELEDCRIQIRDLYITLKDKGVI